MHLLWGQTRNMQSYFRLQDAVVIHLLQSFDEEGRAN
jgi:hypothetical protein